ncbi:hypothetical protein [Leptospira mayottensis]|uniref:hypothetical protein n=1 Tax=Leptospira mayottensis TaxID=1137606 RepID=UPI000E3593C1|nr:hypothetical protein [Leptospira mayottensis]AXR69996.1 hypothetical protein DPV73_18465 [Leptospira mayottensis]
MIENWITVFLIGEAVSLFAGIFLYVSGIGSKALGGISKILSYCLPKQILQNNYYFPILFTFLNSEEGLFIDHKYNYMTIFKAIKFLQNGIDQGLTTQACFASEVTETKYVEGKREL